MTMFKYLPIAGTLFLFACAAPQVEDRSRFNDTASLAAGTLPVDPLLWKALNTFTDTVLHTQATLYANDSAYRFARTSGGATYPAQAQLALVTWQQQDDPHWLGARTAGAIRSVDLITFDAHAAPQYAHYEGHPLKAAASIDPEDSAHLAWALKQPILAVP
ncbi:hypothetical protein [Chitinophaga parva]|nr:hypothetical protein [Chitinophaga parva]